MPSTGRRRRRSRPWRGEPWRSCRGATARSSRCSPGQTSPTSRSARRWGSPSARCGRAPTAPGRGFGNCSRPRRQSPGDDARDRRHPAARCRGRPRPRSQHAPRARGAARAHGGRAPAAHAARASAGPGAGAGGGLRSRARRGPGGVHRASRAGGRHRGAAARARGPAARRARARAGAATRVAGAAHSEPAGARGRATRHSLHSRSFAARPGRSAALRPEGDGNRALRRRGAAPRRAAVLLQRRVRLRLGAGDGTQAAADPGRAAGLPEHARRTTGDDPTQDGGHAMTRAPALLLALALSALIVAPAGAAGGSRLRPFHSCADLGHYARAHARTKVPPAAGVPPPAAGPVTKGTRDGSSNGSASPETPSSATNVQEPGIDEPDLVKTDGGTLFMVAGGKLPAIDARAAIPALLSAVPVEGGGDAQLLEYDGRLLVISRVYAPVPGAPPNDDVANAAMAIAPGAAQTVLTEVDARDPSDMRVVRTMRLDGTFVDARQKEAVARVVVSAAPTVGPRGTVALPQSRLAWGSRKAGHAHRLVRCGAVLHPAAYDGSALLSVLTIDLGRGLPPIDSDAVMTNAQVVYGSPTPPSAATGGAGRGTRLPTVDTPR